ncbi:hypothetical protein RCL1_000515 [Eukaryota sp. TZLM3-RCL]
MTSKFRQASLFRFQTLALFLFSNLHSLEQHFNKAFRVTTGFFTLFQGLGLGTSINFATSPLQQGHFEEVLCSFTKHKSNPCRLKNFFQPTFRVGNMLFSIKLSSFELLFILLDDDIISLERTNCLRRIFIDGDTSAIFHAAQSILSIEQRHGIIVKIVALGRQAMVCAEAVKQLKANADIKLRPISPEIERLIIFDRTFDPITPMCTQLTYEGLLDEIIGINCGSISLSCIHGKEVHEIINVRCLNLPWRRGFNVYDW